ncbi:radical SAM protein [Candidatus Pacearchaeota archaeon]|nr:radical SAM protein [Candidatus Pacearchaeota archaeon]
MLTAVIELTESCNLGCTFCLRPSFKQVFMSSKILEKTIKTLLEYRTERIDFIWHGGEPLILGLPFFKKIIKFQKRYNPKKIKIINNVQTNATLLSKEFQLFFKLNSFNVGTSIQGPQEIHDLTRIDLMGNGTYNGVIKNIKDMELKPSAITVLTTEILGKEMETYNTLKKYSRGARISEYFPGGKNPNKKKVKDPTMPTPKEYGKSMIKFYNIWKKDKNPLELRPITEIIKSFIRKKSEGCIYSQQACNFGVIGITENGDFYTCLRAKGNPKFFLGNIQKINPLKKILILGKRDYNKRINSLKKQGCNKCEFFNYCNGGCPQESLKIFGDYSHKTYYCEGRKMLFKEIKKDLERLKNGI